MNTLLLNTLRLLTDVQQPAAADNGLWKIALIICTACFLIPVVTLSIIVVVKKIIRLLSKSPRAKLTKTNLSKDAFLALFGEGNVVSVDVVMTRVIVEVNDVDLVNLEELKKLNIGVLIAGNTIKCSSEEYANLLTNK